MMKPMLCRWALFGRTPVALACFTASRSLQVVSILTCTFFAACSKPVSRVTIGPSIDLSVKGTTTWRIPGEALDRAGDWPLLRLKWRHGAISQGYLDNSQYCLRITVYVYADRGNAQKELSRVELPIEGLRLSSGADSLVLASLGSVAADRGVLKVDVVVTHEDVLMASGSPYLVIEPVSAK